MIRKKYYLILLLFFLSLNILSQQISTSSLYNSTPPKYEVRAVWLTTIGGLDWPNSYNSNIQKKQLCEILDKLKAANINTVLLQTRVRATTIYPSSLEPFDGCITGHPGKSPSYDPLEYAISECHKRGMELHCWIVTIPVGKWNGYGCKQLRQAHPELIKKIGDEGYMNPEKKGTADYIANLCSEIANKYDIDGIHLDYIRYPETWKNIGNKIEARNNITNIVKAVNNAVKSSKRWIKISCSPIGKYDDLTRYHSNGWNAFSRVFQDAQLWLKDGLMDMLFPMMYFRGNNFYPFAIDWKENSYGRTIVPGLGIYFLSPKEKNWQLEDITREMEVLRSEGMGFAFFRTSFFIDDIKNIYKYTSKDFCKYKALTHPMVWESENKPDTPFGLSIKKNNLHTTISWNGENDYKYNVYASSHIPVNINDSRNLIATRLQNKSIKIKNNDKIYFAITALDRYGNESNPLLSYSLNEDISDDSNNTQNLFIIDNYGNINLDKLSKFADLKHLIITNSMHQVLYSTTSYNNQINVSNLKNGIYILRTINKKGISHKLGYFEKRTKNTN